MIWWILGIYAGIIVGFLLGRRVRGSELELRKISNDLLKLYRIRIAILEEECEILRKTSNKERERIQ